MTPSLLGPLMEAWRGAVRNETLFLTAHVLDDEMSRALCKHACIIPEGVELQMEALTCLGNKLTRLMDRSGICCITFLCDAQTGLRHVLHSFILAFDGWKRGRMVNCWR